MNGKYLILALGAVLYSLVVWVTDPLILMLLIRPVAVIAAAPVGITLIILIYAMATKRSLRPPLIFLGIACAFATLIGAACPLNQFIGTREEAAAKAYPARVAPFLEDYRRKHGGYPSSLNQLPWSAPFVPRLLRGERYHSDGSSYSFWFPASMVDQWDYTSKSGEWILST